MEQDNRPTRQSIAVNDASTFSGTGGKESSQVVITGPESGLSVNSTELYISKASRHLTENAFFKTPPSVADDTLKPWISMLTDADYYMLWHPLPHALLLRSSGLIHSTAKGTTRKRLKQ